MNCGESEDPRYLSDALNLKGDLDFVADQEPAGLEGRVPIEAEVLAVQRRFRFKPCALFPHGSLAKPMKLIGSVTSFVTPRMVSGPVTWSCLLLPVTFVLLKVISGCCSASKKSAERRWPSRSFSLVSTLPVLTLNATDDCSGLASSNWMVPSRSEKLPRTLVIRCRT